MSTTPPEPVTITEWLAPQPLAGREHLWIVSHTPFEGATHTRTRTTMRTVYSEPVPIETPHQAPGADTVEP